MKKLLTLSIIGSSLIMAPNSVKADDWDFWEIQSVGGSTYKINQLNSVTLERTTVATEFLNSYNYNTSYVDEFNNLYVDFSRSLPLVLSSPLLINPILGFSISNNNSASFDPMTAN